MKTHISNSRKVVTAFVGVSLMLFMFAVLSIVSPGGQAHAADCPPMSACGGTGGGGDTGGTGGGTNPGGGGNTGGGSGNNGGGGSGGGGGGGDYDPYGWTERRMPDWAGGGLSCPVRDDGKASIGADYHMTKTFDYGTSATQPPRGEGGWTYSGYFPGSGYLFEMTVQAGRTCLYPPRSHFVSVVCSIQFGVDIQMTRPTNKTLGTATAGTGYSEGSTNYNACINSKGDARLNKRITEYGYFEVNTFQRAQVAKVEIFDEVDIRTGAVPAPKIVSLSPAYNTLKARTSTASLDCKLGFKSPGVYQSDYTERLCQGTTSAVAVCSSMPVQFSDVQYNDFGLTGKQPALSTRTGQNGSQIDKGEITKLVFNQSVGGKGIAVNSYKTKFLRSANSTPWMTANQWNNNSFDLRQTWDGKSVLSQGSGTSTPVYGGKDNEVFAKGLDASSAGSPTKITQELTWSGTRTIQSGTITAINPNTGTVSYTPITLTVPTSGVCSQTVTLEYIRPIGDKIG